MIYPILEEISRIGARPLYPMIFRKVKSDSKVKTRCINLLYAYLQIFYILRNKAGFEVLGDCAGSHSIPVLTHVMRFWWRRTAFSNLE
jgi:hypothetical protein